MTTAPQGYIVRNQFGAFCAACQHHLGPEEDSFDCCDVCGGEGWPEPEDEDEAFEQSSLPPGKE